MTTTKSVEPTDNARCMFDRMTTLATKVRAARNAANISQAELARRIGRSQQAIQKIESGTTSDPKFLVEIAAALSVNPLWLKGLSDEKDAGVIPPKISMDQIKEELKEVPDDKLQQVLDAILRAKSESP